MFTIELNNKSNFFRVKYIENLIARFITASLSLEGLSELQDDPTYALNFYYQNLLIFIQRIIKFCMKKSRRVKRL